MLDLIVALNRTSDIDLIEEFLETGSHPLALVARISDAPSLTDIVTHFCADLLIAEADLRGLEHPRRLREALRAQPNCALILASRVEDFRFEHAAEAIYMNVAGYILLPPVEAQLSRALNAAMDWLRLRDGSKRSPGGASPISVEPAEAYKSEELAERVYQFIVKNHVEPLTMADITNTFFVSESYVNQLLMRYKRKSFKKILTEVRIRHARELMTAYPSLPISDVAHGVGYADSHYFSRMYKALTGISPSFDREPGAPDE